MRGLDGGGYSGRAENCENSLIAFCELLCFKERPNTIVECQCLLHNGLRRQARGAALKQSNGAKTSKGIKETMNKGALPALRKWKREAAETSRRTARAARCSGGREGGKESACPAHLLLVSAAYLL
jgi:hypothetical protein